MTIHCIQHVDFENAGSIAEWAIQNGHQMTYTLMSKSDANLPNFDKFEALFIMGGYMNVDEEAEFAWLKPEKKFIAEAIKQHKKVIGICLGSQLVATALGSRVYANMEKEIGFFPIQFSDFALQSPLFAHFSTSTTVFHWHGDTFDLPPNAQLIASSEACRHQAFLVGNHVLALQFHFEMTASVITDMLHHDGHELAEKGKYITSLAQIQQDSTYLEQNRRDLFLLMDKFLTV